MPIYPDFEDNTVVMDEDEPSSVQAQAKREKARTEKAAKMPTIDEASQYFLKNKQEQLSYLISSTLRIEKELATLTQNQESLERIMEQKFYDLDVKVTDQPRYSLRPGLQGLIQTSHQPRYSLHPGLLVP